MSDEQRSCKLQRWAMGVGPWVDDVTGEWSAPAGDAPRVWQRGLTLAKANELLAINERARRVSWRVPPRRIVPLDHPTNDRNNPPEA